MISQGSFNTTQSVVLTNSIDSGVALMIVVCIIGAIGLLALITSLERYTKFFDTLVRWLSTIKYTVFGGGVVACGYGLYLACGAIASVGSGVDPIWIAEAIGVYIVLTAIGWGASKVVGRVKEMHAKYSESKTIGGDEV